MHIFPRKYLSQNIKGNIDQTILVSARCSESTKSIDQIDLKVLEEISKISTLSHRKRALKAGIPPATFFNKRKQLENLGIISGYSYFLDTEKFGVQVFRILLSFHGHFKLVNKELLKLCNQHHQIRKMVECIGTWDAEIEVEVSNNRDIAELNKLLSSYFGNRLKSVRTFPLLEHLYYQSIKKYL